jgi:hypothetical protein
LPTTTSSSRHSRRAVTPGSTNPLRPLNQALPEAQTLQNP